jgi:hypothetical protein
MNYLAHAMACLDDPYQVAGAATPDWLCMTRPRLRCRSRQAAPFVDADDPRFASLARGILRHHADDDWFHETGAFGDLSMELARQVRRATGDRDGMRPGFLGHILVELLLDAALIAEDRRGVDAYYAALEAVDPRFVANAIGAMNGCDASGVAGLISRFVEIRFLYDYMEDASLLFRLNQVMRRVRLPELPAQMLDILPDARQLIFEQRIALLTPRPATSMTLDETLASLSPA